MNLWELPTLDLAKEILGMKLIHVDDKGTTSGYIVETEAYLGPEDRAAHSFNNRRTARTEVMYDEAGTIYTYFIYGMQETNRTSKVDYMQEDEAAVSTNKENNPAY